MVIINKSGVADEKGLTIVIILKGQVTYKQFGLNLWITGISFYIVSFIFGVGGIMLSMTV